MTKVERSSEVGDLGVDLNRNFDVSFGGAGTSGNPCSNSFRGDGPFSERETIAVHDALRGEKVASSRLTDHVMSN